jgi:lipoprotein signal peptidase
MKNEHLSKYIIFLAIVIAGVFSDQWTKWYAEQRLATQRPGHFTHEMVLTVPEAYGGQTLEAYLTDELAYNTPDEVDAIAGRWVRGGDGARLMATSTLEAGQEVRILRREVTVVEDYWDFQYTRNPGAAFGFLANQDASWRKPFFILVSLFAVGVILYILMGVELGQQILIWGLGLIAAGAIGNFIDRIQFGYVIDFIVWKYTDANRWPTFNVADAFICVGVGFMLIEIARDGVRERREARLAAEGGEGETEGNTGDDEGVEKA